MRLNKKVRLLELIKTIEEGLIYVIKNKGISKETESVLNDCIYGLECVKTNSEGEKVLEEIVDKIKNDILKNSKTTITYLEHVINKLRIVMIEDIETEIEIVFMPYKVSMWDSLESIWKTANEDKNCKCYVVPIPYYELDSQGKPCKICYEGDEFPKDIDIISYKSYDLEYNEPDIIYIHNPYDNTNTLTMVEPRYFSRNLKKYTEMLVYLPYFITGSCFNYDDHFTRLPGAKNADRVIVQSTNHKKVFLENGHSEQRILNLGSPKFDTSLINSSKQFEISEEWRNALNNRKIFLLSTSITDFLGDSNSIENLKEVIECFIDNDECALIWREHPLLEITIKNMKPMYFEEFNKIKEKVLKVNNIVIDKSSDTYKAMAISDALITDYGSIMFQYMITEKPILSLIKKESYDNNRIYSLDYRGCYFLNSGTSVKEFISLVLNDNDVKKKERVEKFKNSITNVDGTAGEKIHIEIKKQVMKKLNNYRIR